MANEVILDKLRKLLEHAESARALGEEDEANTFAAQAQKILLKHKLSMADIKSSVKKDEVVEAVHSTYTKKSIGGNWEFNLIWVIARYNMCQVFRYGKAKNKKFIIIGKSEDVDFCMWLRDTLMERYVKFSKEKYKKFTETTDWILDPIGLDTYQRRYLLGCCDGLRDKFYDEKLARETATQEEERKFNEQVTALVKVNDAEIKLFMENKGYTVGKGQAQRDITGGGRDSAFNTGKQDGRNTNIGKPISNTRTQKALG